MSHAFLSDPWFDAVEAIRDEAPDPAPGLADLVLNIVVTGGPDGDREAHLANGEFGRGLRDGAPTKLTIPFDAARAMLIDGDQQAPMQAFMSGQIRVEGDMTKLMIAMQPAPPTPEQEAFQEKLRALTG